MARTKIAGIGTYLPEKVVTNNDLSRVMDTSDEWIQERTGIVERRYAKKHEESTSTMGAAAARIAMEQAGVTPNDIDFVIFATLSPDYFFPGCGVLLQRQLKLRDIGCLDVRNQCSGFIYGLSVADQFIRSGMYKNILLVGAEFHSAGLDFSTRGRNVTVIFGDGAGAVVLQPATDQDSYILSTHLHSNGDQAETLAYINPGCHGGVHLGTERFGYPDQEFGGAFLTQKMIEDEDIFPHMDGQAVFKTAIVKFPEVIMEALDANGYQVSDLKMLIPHQANLRISQFVQKKLGLRHDQVYNNIMRYGNTTAASIPIALCEAAQEGKINKSDLVCLAAFGSGFTWGSALLKW
ncbi:MAG: ketoacyl-ACP synthase III [Saprospiraceae bacterium]|jgi:3-oxoacyl-[acyl-carrier-protein] synthase-3|nr:ketoacyl-ACP synthase III [Saprospiraceae bacterium]MBK6478816.1 ketoacyl-ACP synthase III [Saprospiraceae bacterium]MBK7436195.1 ketoacyl-ACP synthase III [Saprospiraceae bacterium]MBK7608470.1 ketoacyl-ACP synthase III [Saprospiraceae bacterium]MBK8281373.1 ketoacyl-ACP synthase III [Saprospiraceae bacterium]